MVQGIAMEKYWYKELNGKILVQGIGMEKYWYNIGIGMEIPIDQKYMIDLYS